ncbi:hypothetical protein ACOZ35_03205 [Halorubrum xinjiangense]|uniref:hypothetical protein n=1 Tax=Halorubrum xinjiangense TaxID=261291 RepID=UPI003C6F421A
MRTPPSPDIVAILLALVIISIVVITLWRSRTTGYTPEQLAHRKALKKQLRKARGKKWSVVTDADGSPIYVATISGVHLAHRDPVELGRTVAEFYDSGRPTFAEYYYTDVVRGLISLEESRARLDADCRLRITANLREKVRKSREGISAVDMRREHVDDFRYPPETYDASLRQLVEQGEVQVVGDKLIYLRP